MPFSAQDLLEVFASYHRAVWPLPLGLVVLCFFISLTALRGHQRGILRVYLGLALLWAWMGVVFHWLFFRPLSPFAVVWAALFTLQAGLFLVAAFRPATLVRPGRAGTWFGVGAIAYATIVYPAIGIAAGQHFPSAPSFGLPCPTTIATFGLLALVPAREPRWLPIIPTIWAMVGSVAAGFGLYQDLGLPVVAVGYWLLQWHERATPFSQYFAPAPPASPSAIPHQPAVR
jgi:hypothetical protein